MPDLTVNIPNQHVNRLKGAVKRLGPQLVNDKFPKDGNGNPKEELTNAEAQQVAEAMVRRFLRDVIKQHEAEEAVENARKSALDKVDSDGVIPEPA